MNRPQHLIRSAVVQIEELITSFKKNIIPSSLSHTTCSRPVVLVIRWLFLPGELVEYAKTNDCLSIPKWNWPRIISPEDSDNIYIRWRITVDYDPPGRRVGITGRQDLVECCWRWISHVQKTRGSLDPVWWWPGTRSVSTEKRSGWIPSNWRSTVIVKISLPSSSGSSWAAYRAGHHWKNQQQPWTIRWYAEGIAKYYLGLTSRLTKGTGSKKHTDP